MMKFTLLSLALALCAAQAEVLSLTSENFDSATAGKNIFVKFFAPWCGHCKAMAPAWEKLAADYEGSDITLIAEVDCEEEEELCETFEIQGFPTIHYGDVNEIQDYTGGRDSDSLAKFAKETLEKPICSVRNFDACDPEAQDAIRKLQTKSKEELRALEKEFEKGAEEADAVLQAEIERIEEEYNTAVAAHQEHMENLKKTSHYTHIMALLAKMEEKEEPDL
jgi:protein disulfide-isomerase A6